ncbi:MAG: replicative DNA helicase [Oscillospiraceae bacterium]|nr:replicative DNA helicase [Oscillospiraceae bacterium]
MDTPRNFEAEQAILGSMLVDSRCIPDIISILRPADFYSERNRMLYETMYNMFTQAREIDAVTLLGELQILGSYTADTSAYIADLVEITPTAAHAKAYADIVRDRSQLRALGDAASEITRIVAEGAADSETALEAAEQKIYGIRKGYTDRDLTPVSVVLADAFQYLEQMEQSGGKIPGLPTGIVPLDNQIGGLIDSNLVLIASRPGMGKTSIAMNFALNAARASSKAVAFFSLEMPLRQLGLRLLSSEAAIDSKTILNGTLNAQEWQAATQASIVLSRLHMMFGESASVTVPQIKAMCRRVSNLGLVVIDYLQLMQGSKRSDNRVQEVSEISRSLKIMAKELDVPVLCCAQLSRANESRADKRPQLSDLRESGAIEQDADVVMFLYRDDYYHEDTPEPGIAECIVAKNRHGSTGTVKLHWMGQYTSFSALDLIHR